MKPYFLKEILIVGILLISFQSNAQYNTLKFASHGYYTGLKFDSTEFIEDHFVITITDKKVEILNVHLNDPGKNKMYLERRCLSALKYPTLDGEEYYVWKLGDRKMVLRKENGIRYLSLYQTNEYGLPNEYITFKIVE
ncbi:MAG: hypothetical protein ABFS32_10780 [Bacteroidota bacterium]